MNGSLTSNERPVGDINGTYRFPASLNSFITPPGSLLTSLQRMALERAGAPANMAAAAVGSISGGAAVFACTAMALFYVAILYSPTLILRLPPPSSLRTFLIRRFICAIVSSIVSVLAASALLRLWRLEYLASILAVFGIRRDHVWQAVAIPLILTSLPYAGSLVLRLWWLFLGQREDRMAGSHSRACSCEWDGMQKFACWMYTRFHDVSAWRNYVVAPLTEELVFRACMIPLLLCGGFRTYSIIFLSPVFFSLAHLNHFLELHYQQRYSVLKALMIVGVQLGYTVIFGWYAAFLFVRSGNLICPIVAHIFCNVMGLPALSSKPLKGLVTLASFAGSVGFFLLLFPATNPNVYNARVDHCSCWQGYCYWN